MPHPTDLIARAQAGELDAFQTIYEQQQDRLYRVAYAILEDEQSAKDVVHDTFVKLFESIGTFRGESSFDTWVTTIAINACRGRLRRRKMVQFLGLDWLRGVASDSDVEWDAIKRRERRELWQGVQRLNEKHRIPVVLHYYAHFSCDDIAQMLDIPVRTVYSRLRTARKQLRATSR